MSRPRTSVVGVVCSASTMIQTSASADDNRRTSAATRFSLFMALHDQHRVSIAEKAVLLLHGCLIGKPRQINYCEGGHEQQQSGTRQMKVCDQCFNYAKRIGRLNE